MKYELLKIIFRWLLSSTFSWKPLLNIFLEHLLWKCFLWEFLRWYKILGDEEVTRCYYNKNGKNNSSVKHEGSGDSPIWSQHMSYSLYNQHQVCSELLKPHHQSIEQHLSCFQGSILTIWLNRKDGRALSDPSGQSLLTHCTSSHANLLRDTRTE